MKRYTHTLTIGIIAATLLMLALVFYAGNEHYAPQTGDAEAAGITESESTGRRRSAHKSKKAAPLNAPRPNKEAKRSSPLRPVQAANLTPPKTARNTPPAGKTAPKVVPRKKQDVANPDRAGPAPGTNTAATQEVEGTDAEDLPAMVWSVDKDGIQGAIRDTTPAIKECYHAWLKAEKALAGRIVISFTISANPEDPEMGRISKVGVNESELDHTLLEGCVLNAVSEISWEAPDEPVIVSYPFSFSSAE